MPSFFCGADLDFSFFLFYPSYKVRTLGSPSANSVSVWFAAQKLMHSVPHIAEMKPPPLECSLQALN